MSFTVDTRSLRLTLLTLVLIAGAACSRWSKAPPALLYACCHGRQECLSVLQDVDGQDPGQAPLTRALPAEQECAVVNLMEEGAGVIPSLIPLLDHVDSRVRGGAASVLAHLQQPVPPGLVPSLIKAAEREPRGYAMAALIRTDDARALPVLRRHFTQIPDQDLAKLGPNLSPLLLEVLEDPTSSQQALMRVSAAMGEPRALSAEWTPRLSALLRRELNEPVLRRPPDAECPVPPVQGCQLLFDGCTPRAAYVMWALAAAAAELAEAEQLQALAGVREALQRGDARLTPLALAVLSSYGSPEAVELLLKQLAIPTCRSYALTAHGLWRPEVRSQVMAPLLALADSDEEGWIRAGALRALWNVEEEAAWETLRRALESNHSEIQAAALLALGEKLGQKHAPELIPILERVARETRSPIVWEDAQRSLESLRQPSKEHLPPQVVIEQYPPFRPVVVGRATVRESPEWMRCPRVTRLEGGLKVKIGNEEVLLRSVEGRRDPAAKGLCAELPDSVRTDLLEPVGPACFVGHDHGEFGGRLSIYEKGSMTIIPWALNPVGIVSPRGAVVLLDSLPHMSTSGELIRFERVGPGEWRPIRWVTLPGSVSFFGYTRSGDLVLATLGRWMDADEVCDRPDAFYGYVLHVTPDGQIVAGK